MQTPTGFDGSAWIGEIAWLRALALQLVRDAALADDAVAETLLAAWSRRPALEKSPRAWLARVLQRQIALALRGARHRREREERAAQGESLPSAAELSLKAEAQRDLANAVLALSEPYRSVVLLRYFEGFEPAEIAARRGVPAGTVRSQLARALAELRAVLDREHAGKPGAWCAALAPSLEPAGWTPAGLLSLSSIAGVAMQKGIAFAACAVLVAVLAIGLGRRGISPEGPAAHTDAAARPAEVALPRASELAQVAEPAREPAPAAPAGPAAAGALGAKRAREAPALRGRVLDEALRTPLPRYFLQIADATGALEDLWTDARGHFESRVPRAAGALEIVLRDADGAFVINQLNGRRVTWTFGTERTVQWNGVDELELLAPASLTFELAFAPPAGLAPADFDAYLLAHDPDAQAGTYFGTNSPVRGEPPFARFLASSAVAKADEPAFLRLVSRDGLWRGQAPVDCCAPRTSGPVWIELEPAACLEIELSGANPGALARPSLRLVSSGGAFRDANPEELGPGRERWRAVFAGLASGTYELSAQAEGMEPQTLAVIVRAGETTSRALALEPIAEIAWVRGELTGRSGEAFDQLTVLLFDPNGREIPSQWLEWIERDGTQVAPFAFENIAPGEYRLMIFEGSGANRPWSPVPGAVTAPAEGLKLVCDDLAAQAELVFRVLDAATGEPLENAHVSAEVEGRQLIGGGSAGGVFRFATSHAGPVAWSAECPGYLEQQGDTESTPLAPSEGPERVFEIRLERAP